MLNVKRKVEFSELAEFIADEYCSGDLVTPIDIIRAKKITYSEGNYKKSFDGMIEHAFGKFHIYLNLDKVGHAYTARARFTLAHELGHFFIDEHRNALSIGNVPAHPSFNNFQSTNIVEREADYFAACLLLPESRVTSHCFKRKFNFNILDELSKKYQTSLTSTAIRFSEIGNHPIMIVFCRNNKIIWKWNSKDFPYFYLKNDKILPKDTTAAEFFNLKRSYKRTQEVFADDWFKVYDKRYDRKFYEHCLCSGNNNCTLSILWEE